jgi:AhpD family alkylhydroperoxidase
MNSIKLPEVISSRIEYKKRYSFVEMYYAFVTAPRAITKIIGNKREKLVDEKFIERLQLAVTEVNGCAACSYAHAYMALKQGMSNEEICSFLKGEDTFVKQEEAKAIAFAQHFADSRGVPNTDAYNMIINEYGEKKSRIILSAVQIMIAGNIYGIPFSAFHSRLKGKPYKGSSMFYEIGMLLAGLLCLPIATIHGLFKGLLGFKNVSFAD